jgi:plasmid maintenance system antidote protein VapI
MKSKKSISVDQKRERDEFDHEKEMLMKRFLYEVFKIIRGKKFSKSQLAQLLDVSPGYLSQVFHNKKPLTFDMLIKIQRVLKIEFEIKARPHP